jgi:hypothetical protein
MKKHVVNEHGVNLNQYKEHKKTINEESGVNKKGKIGKQCFPIPLLSFFLARTFIN